MTFKKIHNYISRAILSILLIFSVFIYDYSKTYAAANVSYTTNGTYTWTVPSGVTSATVQVWGAGGGGGGSYSSVALDGGWNGGGGGGGEFRQTTISNLTSGSNYTVVVGAGGAYGTSQSSGSNGGFSSFGGTTIKAFGGSGGGGSSLSAGGSGGPGGSGGTGNIGYSGGSGSQDTTGNYGGGGGSSAGTSSAGVSSTSNSGGVAPSGGGNGGAAGSGGSSWFGVAGSSPGGGGGGGGYRIILTNYYSYRGGAGADGQVLITYVSVNSASTSVNVAVNPVINITDGNSGTTTIPAITPTSAGRMSAATDSLAVTSNDSAGYKVTIQMTGSTNTLNSGGNSIAAAIGTTTTPAVLSANSWGFCVPSNSGNGSYTTVFGTCDGSLSSAAISSNTYAAVPKSTDTPFILFNTASSSVGNYNTVVTFAAAVDNSTPSGTYTGTVVFTAVTN